MPLNLPPLHLLAKVISAITTHQSLGVTSLLYQKTNRVLIKPTYLITRTGAALLHSVWDINTDNIPNWLTCRLFSTFFVRVGRVFKFQREELVEDVVDAKPWFCVVGVFFMGNFGFDDLHMEVLACIATVKGRRWHCCLGYMLWLHLFMAGAYWTNLVLLVWRCGWDKLALARLSLAITAFI